MSSGSRHKEFLSWQIEFQILNRDSHGFYTSFFPPLPRIMALSGSLLLLMKPVQELAANALSLTVARFTKISVDLLSHVRLPETHHIIEYAICFRFSSVDKANFTSILCTEKWCPQLSSRLSLPVVPGVRNP